MKITPLSDWLPCTKERPVVIAGPCSAESEEQVVATARALQNSSVTVFRAGIWKPRTRPGSFEGVGSIGLKWLQSVKQETGMAVATEVANYQHVHEALHAGIDILWIGARTSVNPFAVQEIADALKGWDIPVLVKNPINPDISLWQGAIERIADAGITRIGAIHRGFSGVSRSDLRNEPLWQLPIELRRRLPGIPMICDPSHIAGRSDLVGEVALRALTLDYHGLMIETHCNPAEAWSDAAQQLTPAELSELLKHAEARRCTTEDANYQRELSEQRAVIDEIDSQVLELLARRMETARRIGEIKKANNVAVLQSGRWNQILERIHKRAKQYGFSTEFVDSLFQAIHQESISQQQELILHEESEAK